MKQFTSHINFSLTKKRFKAMYREKNATKTAIMKISLVPFLVCCAFLFGEYSDISLLPDVQPSSQLSVIDSAYSGSPYYHQFAERLTTYQNIYREYEAGEKTKRDVLYQRIRLVWLHQRLEPEEQKMFEVPDLPVSFSENIPLTEAEQRYQSALESYIAYRESLDQLPDTFDHELYEKYDALRSLYENLDFYAQIFVVDNLPNVYRRHVWMADQKKDIKDRSMPPMQMTLSKQKPDLAVHYLDEHGNAVSTKVGDLSENEIEYLMENTKKSLVTQVYPLPEERVPTEKEIEKWQDDYYYQIWLDGEVIENEQLLDMDLNSLHHFRIHEVQWNANRRVPYDYQVLMYTHDAFDEMIDKYRPSKGMLPFHKSILIR